MEAARVAALRGHDVVLYEHGNRLGGQLLLARLTPDRDDIGLIADWLSQEIARLGVDVRLGHSVSAESLAKIGPVDVAIVATGPSPRGSLQLGRPTLVLSPTASTSVVSSWQLMSGSHHVPPGPVVLLDDVGHMEAMGVAQHLTERGCGRHVANGVATGRIKSVCRPPARPQEENLTGRQVRANSTSLRCLENSVHISRTPATSRGRFSSTAA